MNTSQLHHTEILEDRITGHVREIFDEPVRFDFSHHEPEDADEAHHEVVGFELETELECLFAQVKSKQLLTHYLRFSMERLNGRIVEPNHIVIRDTAEFKIQVKAYGDGDDRTAFVHAISRKTGNWITAICRNYEFADAILTALNEITCCAE